MSTLSEGQLNRAAWVYEHQPQFKKGAFLTLLGITILLVLIFIVNLILYIVSLQGHREYVLYGTQEEIIREDPALIFAPRELIIQKVDVAKQGGRGADFLATIHNPNTSWQAAALTYHFEVDTTPLVTQTSFALPGINYVVEFYKDPRSFREVNLIIDTVTWRRINQAVGQERLDLFDITVSNTQFVPGDQEEIFDTLQGTLVNNTPFDFWNVMVIAYINNRGTLLAVGQGNIEQFFSGEEREVVIGVGIVNTSRVDEIMLIPIVNILDDRNIM